MSKFKYYIIVCITIFYFGCNLRQANTANFDENKDQIALADSILLYFQQEQFDKIVTHFDDKMKQLLNKEQLAVVWALLNTQFGKYKKSEFYGIEKINDVGDKVVYKCFFGSQKLYFQLVLGKENRVVGLFFKPQPN